MSQDHSEIMKNKSEILEDLKKLYRINPITSVIVLIVMALILGTIFRAIKDFGTNLTSDLFGALINLFLAWNLGFGLYKGIWPIIYSRKINKVLFPEIQRLIDSSGEKSYEETEAEVHEKVKETYADYTQKYNKLNDIYWISFKISCALPLIALIILFIYNR